MHNQIARVYRKKKKTQKKKTEKRYITYRGTIGMTVFFHQKLRKPEGSGATFYKC